MDKQWMFGCSSGIVRWSGSQVGIVQHGWVECMNQTDVVENCVSWGMAGRACCLAHETVRTRLAKHHDKFELNFTQTQVE